MNKEVNEILDGYGYESFMDTNNTPSTWPMNEVRKRYRFLSLKDSRSILSEIIKDFVKPMHKKNKNKNKDKQRAASALSDEEKLRAKNVIFFLGDQSPRVGRDFLINSIGDMFYTVFFFCGAYPVVRFLYDRVEDGKEVGHIHFLGGGEQLCTPCWLENPVAHENSRVVRNKERCSNCFQYWQGDEWEENRALKGMREAQDA